MPELLGLQSHVAELVGNLEQGGVQVMETPESIIDSYSE